MNTRLKLKRLIIYTTPHVHNNGCSIYFQVHETPQIMDVSNYKMHCIYDMKVRINFLQHLFVGGIDQGEAKAQACEQSGNDCV